MKYLLNLLGLLPAALTAQIVWTEPAFPSQDEPFTVYYDASQGNGDVEGVIPIYCHTGVITNYSANDTDWQNVIGNWGTADAEVLMTFEGGTTYSFDYGGQNLEDFHGLEADEVVDRLAFVFRNVTGTLVGREADGSDIFFDMPDAPFALQVLSPTLGACSVLQVGESQDFDILISQDASISLSLNGSEVASGEGTELQHTETFTESGQYEVTVEASNAEGGTISESFNLIVLPETIVEAAPDGTKDGVNIVDDNTVILQLRAPFKEYIFAVGDHSDWQLDMDYLMKQVPGAQKWWVEISGLNPGEQYRYQYWIDDECLKVADPYSELVLDPWNDPWIPEESFPNMPDYPSQAGNEPVTVFQTNPEVFDWTDGSYERPDQTNLVVYELLIRDFTDAKTYKAVEDSLGYLKDLGITALELMPFNEFNGNNSWGYNPTFYFAPDKFYGTKQALQSLINACHQEGIAVIMDVAFNHADIPNPQLKMYWDPEYGDWGGPADNNPWFNQEAPHGITYFFDYDHSSVATKEYVKDFMDFWVEEYHIDGWRWDFTQGMTQTNTIGGWAGQYDQFRIDLLNEYGNHIWATDPGVYMILEHWCDASEEQALSNNGFMVWANVTHQYQEGTMGYSSNFAPTSYWNAGFGQPHVLSYIESHDEERLMFKNLEFGNSAGSYDISNLQTALRRIELSACFNLPIPGPKMIWQFGELGYDYSINYCEDGTINDDCRVAPKPIRWDYYDDPDRLRIYQVMAAINELKRDYPSFQTTDFSLDTDGTGKRIHLYHPDMDVVIVGNFDVVDFNMVPGFPHTGTWYNFFTGESFEVTDLNASFYYLPGDYAIYTDQPLPTPQVGVGIEEHAEAGAHLTLYPNPSTGEITLDLELPQNSPVTLEVVDLQGRLVGRVDLGTVLRGTNTVNWNGQFDNGDVWSAGTYVLRAVLPGGVLAAPAVRR